MENIKIIRPRNYLYEFLVFLNGLVLILVWGTILRSVREAILAGSLSYMILAWCLRLTFQKHHRKGMQLMRAKDYPAAAIAFQNSYDYFAKHPAIDKYRFITMFSSNAIPFQQMALNNMGICCLYNGEDAKALDTFQKLAQLNPDYSYITKTIEELQRHIAETADC